MTKSLAEFKFTPAPNKAISNKGWIVEKGVVVDALGGNDIIRAFSPSNGGFAGINNAGTIEGGAGNDIIKGISVGEDSVGIYNTGTINTGDGADTLTASSSPFYISFFNSGTINTGKGNDLIDATALNDVGDVDFGLYNTDTGKIITGTGNDTIRGAGGELYSFGINNAGMIKTGAGNDIITGTSNASTEQRDAFGIINDGTINTGSGDDIIDALKGGFNGEGKIDLGSGNDTLKGFGEGKFHGGTGNDKLLFGTGTYTVSGSTIVHAGVTMNVNDFEQIGGVNGGLFGFGNGTLTVDAAGVGIFA